MKTEIYNLIILDESGSMGCVEKQTINGCNETINTIKASQEKFAENQDHYVSIFAFQSGATPSRYLVKNIPASSATHITGEDYRPCGCTPLFDAIGSTLVDMQATMRGKENAIGSVTIITDGEENSSRHYTAQQVAKMISALKEMGWNFNFIGANIDVERYANMLNIDNSLAFKQDDEGTRRMFARERRSRMVYHQRLNEAMDCLNACEAPTEEMRIDSLRKAAGKYFDPDPDDVSIDADSES